MKIKLWTEAEINTLKASSNLLSTRELEKVFGGKYTCTQIRGKLRQLGLHPRPLTSEERGQITVENSKHWPQLCRKEINHDFFKTWSSSMAYITGLWFADGNISKLDSNKYFFNLSLKKSDSYLLEKILHEMGSEHHLREEHGSLRIQISSKTIHGDLLNLGGTPIKSKTAHFPMVPSQYISDFIRGYHDGDGYICDKKHVIILLGTKDFLNILYYILLSNNIKASSLNIHNPEQGSNICHRLTVCGPNAIRFCDFIYTNINTESFYLHRKYERFLNWHTNESL